MSPTFQPPTADTVPPVYLSWPDHYRPVPRLAQRLFRHYKNRAAGINVYLTTAGEYTTEQPLEADIAKVYHGGHVIPVTQAEADALTAAGFGAGIT